MIEQLGCSGVVTDAEENGSENEYVTLQSGVKHMQALSLKEEKFVHYGLSHLKSWDRIWKGDEVNIGQLAVQVAR